MRRAPERPEPIQEQVMSDISYATLNYQWLNGDAKGFAKYLENAKNAFKSTPRRTLEEVVETPLIDIGGGLRAKVVEVTPAIAWELLLQHNVRNRPISFAHARKIAIEMEADRWGLTHQGGAFNSEGDIEDVQHRLAGIAMSGKTIEMVIMDGLPDDLFKRIDIGKIRSIGSSLALAGHNGASSLLGAVIRDLAVSYDERTLTFFASKNVKKRYIGPLEANEYVEDHPTLEDAVHEALETHGAALEALADKKVGAFVYWRICEDWGQDIADEFMETLGDDEVAEKTPVGALHRRLDKHKLGKLAGKADAARKNVLRSDQILWLTAAAFRAWRKNQRSAVRLDPRGDDEFPRFEDSAAPDAEAA
jgi:hypothetical protein